MSEMRSGMDCSRIECILPTISWPSNERSSNNQLPALPNIWSWCHAISRLAFFYDALSFRQLIGSEGMHLSVGFRHYIPPRLSYSAVDEGRHIGTDI